MKYFLSPRMLCRVSQRVTSAARSKLWILSSIPKHTQRDDFTPAMERALKTIERVGRPDRSATSTARFHFHVFGQSKPIYLPSALQVFQTLGVEAARIIISEEITYIMKAYGISIDRRHLLLLADVMTFKVQSRRLCSSA